METARQRILRQLERTRAASARELARALKMSAPNVRHHLAVLLVDSRVEVVSARRRAARERPEQLYSLSDSEWGENLAILSGALFAQAGKKFSESALAAQILDARQFAGLPRTKRLALLVEKLNRMSYHARWEASAAGPQIVFAHCPYARIIDSHPELCKVDAALLGTSLDGKAEQLAKIAAKMGVCIFSIR